MRNDEKKNREKRGNRSLKPKHKRMIVLVLVLLVLIGITYGRSIIRLKMENRELKQQQEELLAEKQAKVKELKNANTKEYIQEQARKQLRLLNKDEILFIFEDKDDDQNKN